MQRRRGVIAPVEHDQHADRQYAEHGGVEQPARGSEAKIIGPDAAIEVVAGQAVGTGQPVRVGIDVGIPRLAEGGPPRPGCRAVELA